MDKQRFVEFYFPAARMAGNLYRINPVVILAQSAIESGWGESTLAQEYNNFFGLTGYGVVNAYWHGGKTDQGKEEINRDQYYADQDELDSKHNFSPFLGMGFSPFGE